MKRPRTIIEKIWDSHVVQETENHPVVFAIDFMLLHEVTSAQAFDVLREKSLPLAKGIGFLATLDHSIPTSSSRLHIVDEAARKQVEALRRNAIAYNIPLLDFDRGQGIVHVVGPELGLTRPGMTIVCGDSHTATHGAFGALAFGIGTSEVGHVLATGCLLQRKPLTMKVEINGKLKPGVYAKDIILKLIQRIGVGGATGYVIEYSGSAVKALSMEERMTVCNMSIECGARAGLVAPDEVTFNYLKGRKHSPSGEEWEKACAYWSSLCSDVGAEYDRTIELNIDNLEPVVTWGTNPAQALELGENIPAADIFEDREREALRAALAYVKLSPGDSLLGIPVDHAFIGSCTNGRIEDLRVAASILKGRKVKDGVRLSIVPGSEAVREEACSEGLDIIFAESGADFRMPGCSMCLGMNEDKVPAGKRCISSSNRNFVGRQGTGSITHLASPATVAASAVSGKITHPSEYL